MLHCEHRYRRSSLVDLKNECAKLFRIPSMISTEQFWNDCSPRRARKYICKDNAAKAAEASLTSPIPRQRAKFRVFFGPDVSKTKIFYFRLLPQNQTIVCLVCGQTMEGPQRCCMRGGSTRVPCSIVRARTGEGRKEERYTVQSSPRVRVSHLSWLRLSSTATDFI